MFQLQWSQQTGMILMSLTILEMELGLSAPSESLDPARDAAFPVEFWRHCQNVIHVFGSAKTNGGNVF